jgi:chitin-binding protein
LVTAAALVGLVAATPAFAHGAPTTPISRNAACAGGGQDTGAAACKAALKANGQGFGAFDNLRVPNVNGADKSKIPDGQLCSGGLSAFKGLNLPRTDWPSTTLTAGGTFTVVYKATIPHDGGFRIYLTKPGYDPSKALTWDDLSSSPILTVKNAKLSNGAYRMSGKLPADRSGRHVLYVVWQTTSTPDTYYSCSDLVIKAAAATTTTKKAVVTPVKKSPAPPPAPATRSAAPAAAPATTSAAPAVAVAETPVLASSDANWKADVGRKIVVGALLVIVVVAAAVAVRRIRRRPAAR